MVKEMNMNKIKNKVNKILNTSSEDLKNINKNPKRALRSLFVPTFLSLLCLSVNGFVDSIFVAEVGQTSLVAVGIIQSIFVVIIGLGTGLSVATNSILSYYISKKLDKKIEETMSNSIVMTLLIGITSSIILVILLKPLIATLNIHAAYNEALTYGYIIFGGNVFFFFSSVIPAILKSYGEVTKSTIALTSTSLFNVLLDYLLIHELGYGVLGAAFATTFCSCLCGLMLIYFMRTSDNIHLKLSSLKNFDYDIIKRILIDSMPVAFESVVLSLFAFIANMIFNVFTSTIDLAIFVAVLNIIKFTIIPTTALSETNVTITAHLFGSNNFDMIKKLLKYEVKIAFLVSVIIWIFIFLFNDVFASIYSTSKSPLFLYLMTQVLPIYALTLVLMSFSSISISMLQGIQKYKASFILSSVRSVFLELLFGLIFAIIFERMIWIYLGFIIGTFIGSVIAFIASNIILNRTIKEINAKGV